MRRLTVTAALAMIFALACLGIFSMAGCGSELGAELEETLNEASGRIATLSFVCLTQDGDRAYREEVDISFPATYRYLLYETIGGQERLISLIAQSGGDLLRAAAAYDESGAITSVEAEEITGLPPIRSTGSYLGLYHLVGNADYFQSILYLFSAGDLEVTAKEDLEGASAFHLRSLEGLTPSMELWLDSETGLPLRKSLQVSQDRTINFRYLDMRENEEYAGGDFPPDLPSTFGVPTEVITSTRLNRGSLRIDPDSASAAVGFVPLIPAPEGFELAEAWWRDPAVADLPSTEEQLQFPDGYRELFLVYRSGPRQLEIREAPYDPEFDYRTTSAGALAGIYLTQREIWGEDAGGALYTAALDCQELYIEVGQLVVQATGDLSYAEFESLARDLVGSVEGGP